MGNLALGQVFGQGAYQDINVLIIQKASLPLLTPLANNSAEQILVGLSLKLYEEFFGSIEDENGNALTTENEEPLEYDNTVLYDRLILTHWRHQYIERQGQLYKLDTFLIDFWMYPATLPGFNLQPDLV